jgi:hypothetical protein
MVSLELARRLKEAGLLWQPTLHDFFAVPDRGMDDLVFVISDVQVTVERLQGVQVMSFQGASEWALDSLIKEEAVWLPSEEQLRLRLEAALLAAGRPEYRLSSGLGGFRLQFNFQEKEKTFSGGDASQVYAQGLLAILRSGK